MARKASGMDQLAVAQKQLQTAKTDEVLVGATRGGVVIVPPLKEKVEKKLGKTIALSTLYRMLARNG